MKNDKNEIIRIQNMIENERLNFNENINDIMISDLDKVLRDFFDYKQKPQIEIKKHKGEIEVKILISAVNFRPLGYLPKN
jgi:hypothetical protein